MPSALFFRKCSSALIQWERHFIRDVRVHGRSFSLAQRLIAWLVSSMMSAVWYPVTVFCYNYDPLRYVVSIPVAVHRPAHVWLNIVASIPLEVCSQYSFHFMFLSDIAWLKCDFCNVPKSPYSPKYVAGMGERLISKFFFGGYPLSHVLSKCEKPIFACCFC